MKFFDKFQISKHVFKPQESEPEMRMHFVVTSGQKTKKHLD